MAQEQNISTQLDNLLVTRNFSPEMLDRQGKPSESEDAKTFTFDYVSGSGKNYGTMVVILDSDNDMKVFYGDNLGRAMEGDDKDEFFDFQQHLSKFARMHRWTYTAKDLNQLKHTMQGLAAIQEGLFEGYYGTRKISYAGEPTEARLMIKHNRTLGEADARFRYVESLFIETADSQRFKLAFKNLAGGRAMLEHVRQGGNPYDVRGVHISEMVMEIATLSRFNRASASRMLEGTTKELVTEAQTYYKSLRENMKRMASPRGYNAYFETWHPATIDEQQDLVEDIKTLFIEQTLDTRIEAALPLLARIQQQGNAMKEAQIFENWINNLSEGTWALPETPEQLNRLKELMATELIVGPDATNATEQLYDLIGDDILFDRLSELAERDPRANVWDDTEVMDRLAELGIEMPEPSVPGNPAEPATAPVAEGSGDPQIPIGMKTQYGTVVSVNVKKNTVTVRASNGELTTVNIQDIDQAMAEDQLDEIGNTPAGKAALRAVQNRATDTMDTWSKNSASGYSSTPKQVKKATGAAVSAGNRLHGFGPDRMQQNTVMARDALRKGMAEGADFSAADKVEELVRYYKLFDKRGWTDLFAKLAGRKLQGVPEISREMEYASKFLDLLDSIRMRSDYRGQQDPKKDQELIDLSNQWLDLLNQAEDEFKTMSGQGMAEGSSENKYSNLSNRGVNRGINRAGDDFNRMMDLDQVESPHYKTQHQQDTKQRLKTKPMAGPKGVLPEQGVAEGMVKGEYGRVLDALQLYYPRLSMDELNVPGYHKVVADKANVPVEYAARVINDFTRDNDPDEDEFDDDEQAVAESAELNTMLKYAGIPVAESRILDEAGETLDHILNRFKHEVAQFEQDGELDDNLYDALYDYYSDAGEIPYGIAKARTGDPYQWVSDRLDKELGVNESNSGMIMPEADPISTFEVMSGFAAPVANEEIDPMDSEKTEKFLKKAAGVGTLGVGLGILEGSCNMTMEGEYCPEHGLMECGMGEMTVAGSMAPVMGEAGQDPMHHRGAVTDSFYESTLARIKSLALIK